MTTVTCAQCGCRHLAPAGAREQECPRCAAACRVLPAAESPARQALAGALAKALARVGPDDLAAALAAGALPPGIGTPERIAWARGLLGRRVLGYLRNWSDAEADHLIDALMALDPERAMVLWGQPEQARALMARMAAALTARGYPVGEEVAE